MKHSIVICFLYAVSFSLYAQENNKFKFFKIRPTSVSYSVTPTFEERVAVKQESQGLFYVLDQAYYNAFYYDIIKRSLPDRVLNSLTLEERTRSQMRFQMDSDGKILYVYFFIKEKDRPLFSDDILFELYQNLKKSQFDMSKINISFDYDVYPNREVEKGKKYYCDIGVPFIPKGFEHRP
jgi:hypothetical protein